MLRISGAPPPPCLGPIRRYGERHHDSKKEAEQTADLCRSAGGDVVVVQGDVSRDEDCKRIVAAAASWGRLDALINNAGTTKHVVHEDLNGLSAEDFQRLYGVNTIGPFANTVPS